MEGKEMLDKFLKSEGDFGNGAVIHDARWDGCKNIDEWHVGLDIDIECFISVAGQGNNKELRDNPTALPRRVEDKQFFNETARCKEIQEFHTYLLGVSQKFLKDKAKLVEFLESLLPQ